MNSQADSRSTSSLLLSLALVLCANTVPAAVFTVTNTDDSGAGSLRQAMEEANSLPGLDTIQFAIAGAGPHSIRPESALPPITDPLVMDGATQPGFSGQPLIELDGSQAGAEASGFWILCGQSTIRSLVINRFGVAGIQIDGNGSQIEGNYIGTDVTGTGALGNGDSGMWVWGGDNQIGGNTPAARNIISGNGSYGVVLIRPNNRVQGNFIGTDRTGTAAIGQGAGVFVCCDSTSGLIGGTAPGEGNLISGNDEGIDIRVSGTVVEGNLLGTDETGAAALGNRIGIYLADNASGNRIGGAAPGAGNVISGNHFRGIAIFHSGSTGNIVEGNRIGTDASGTAALPNYEGIFIADGASNNRVGGRTPGAGNLIAFNPASAITVVGGMGHGAMPQQNTIQANSIHANGGLAIDLVDGEVEPIGGSPTINDPLDADVGPNSLLNYPELKSGLITPNGLLTVKGTIHTAPGAIIDIEFFGNPDCDPSGHGEGAIFLGACQVETDSAGYGKFTAVLRGTGWAAGWVLTATATDMGGNTSEFSPCVAVSEAGPPGDRNPPRPVR